MTKKEFYYPSTDGKTQIHAIRWEPEGEPKAILQIIHGMVEFIDRYDDFAKYLTEHGYLVTGEDLFRQPRLRRVRRRPHRSRSVCSVR